MKSAPKTPIVASRTVLIVLCAFVAVLSILLWELCIDGPPPAEAQTPRKNAIVQAVSDAALLQDILDEQKKTNAKLDGLSKMLTSGDVKVEIVSDDDPTPKTPAPTPTTR